LWDNRIGVSLFLRRFPGIGENLWSHVTALLAPLIGLLGQDRADQPDGRVTVREDPHHVSPSTNFFI
jgi:hypothetical protein